MRFVVVEWPDRRDVLELADWTPLDTPIDQALITAACPASPGERR
jgi:hypothetical protein